MRVWTYISQTRRSRKRLYGTRNFVSARVDSIERVLVAVELKSGPFKPAYLGQLSGYLRILDDFERREHENPSIGLVPCKDMDKGFVDYVIQDFTKPMGVATYKTSKDMPRELLDALPPIDDLRMLLERSDG